MEVVLDASVAVIVLVELTPRAHELRVHLESSVRHAPHLIDAEVGSVLRRRTAAGEIEPDLAMRALQRFGRLAIERYAHGPLVAAAWRLRHNVTFYDALYVALAARLGVPLLTADARLAHAPGLPCEVEVIR